MSVSTLPARPGTAPKMPGAPEDYAPQMPEMIDVEDSTTLDKPEITDIEDTNLGRDQGLRRQGQADFDPHRKTDFLVAQPSALMGEGSTSARTTMITDPRTTTITDARTTMITVYDESDENNPRLSHDEKVLRFNSDHSAVIRTTEWNSPCPSEEEHDAPAPGRKSFNLRALTKRRRNNVGQEPQKSTSGGEMEDPAWNMPAQIQRAVFADAAAMKAKVKENIMKPEYNVAQFYKDEGYAQEIARSTLFDNATMAIIFFNALWIWIDTDYNTSPTFDGAHPVFIIVENLFCVYFFSEIIIRYIAFKAKRDCLRDPWFMFDSLLVLVMVLETWLINLAIWMFNVGEDGGLSNTSILRLVRLLRITRMARMARLLHAMPELMILVKGISVAARSVFFTLLLLIIILYIFAVVFRQLCADNELEESHFASVPEAMVTLLLQGVLPDQGTLVTDLGNQHLVFGAVAIVFVLLSSLTIINMLIGVLCEVVGVVSSVEKEQMMLNFVKSKLLSLIGEKDVDKDDNLCISKEEFEKLLLLPEGARVIQEVGVDVVVLVDLLDDIFLDDESSVSFADVMELVLQMRGSNTATVRDVVDLRKYLSQITIDSNDHVIEKVTEVVAQTVFHVVAQQLEGMESRLKNHSG